MVDIFGREGERRFIRDGAVYCVSRRGSVELDRCLACPRLVEIDDHAGRPFLRCDAAGSRLWPSWLLP
jgi:hypothetical protein